MALRALETYVVLLCLLPVPLHTQSLKRLKRFARVFALISRYKSILSRGANVFNHLHDSAECTSTLQQPSS